MTEGGWVSFASTTWEDRRIIGDLRGVMGVDMRLIPVKPSHLRIQIDLVCTKVSAGLWVIRYLSSTGPHSGGYQRPVENMARMLVEHLAFTP